MGDLGDIAFVIYGVCAFFFGLTWPVWFLVWVLA